MTPLDHLTKIYNDSDPYVQWSEEIKLQVFSALEVQEKKKELVDKLFGGMFGPHHLHSAVTNFPRPDNGFDNFKKLYGFSDSPSLYLEKLKIEGMKYYEAGYRKKLDNTICGILPTVYTIDHYNETPSYARLANAFAFKVEKNCYIAAMTTQLSKIIMDWSVIIGSTAPDESGEIEFHIPIEEVIPALAYLVSSRWLSEEAPPTWEMKWTPEKIQSKPVWMLMSNSISYAIHFFFTHHELAHVALGHLDKIEESSSIIQKTEADEFEADTLSAHVTANYLKENYEFNNDKSLIQYACISIIRFLSFTKILDDKSDDMLNKHPNGIRRSENVSNIFLQYFPEFKPMFNHYLTITPGFNDFVASRLK